MEKHSQSEERLARSELESSFDINQGLVGTGPDTFHTYGTQIIVHTNHTIYPVKSIMRTYIITFPAFLAAYHCDLAFCLIH